MGRFLGEGTCFLFDSEPIDCHTAGSFAVQVGIIVVQSDYCSINRTSGFAYKPYSRICNPAAYKTCCLQCRQIANLPERNNLPERRQPERNAMPCEIL